MKERPKPDKVAKNGSGAHVTFKDDTPVQQVEVIGRPTKYTQEIADAICKEVSTTSTGLRKICENNGLDYATVKRWIMNNETFCAQYTKAKQEQSDHLADEILEIADAADNDTVINENGTVVANHEWINRSRLRVDARKWIASKLKPKKYGDKMDHTTGGQPFFKINTNEDTKGEIENL